ncbi:hypothetical protein [Acinetobacter nosocomialis]|uniref:hypothetical protein n=1 Tax=Acinetobacter nosocomialis TaxID=106654 RepID=UPI002011E14B|nr:hypothetical protein [Acinetobacter nosocomialis]
MSSYKIRVKTEAERKETQEILFELGYQWPRPTNKKILTDKCIRWLVGSRVLEKLIIQVGCGTEEATEITIAGLRDKAVLHRNDVNDANWETEGGDQIYKDSNDKSFIFRSSGWDELQRHEMRQAMWEKPLLPKGQPSGASTEFKTIKVEGLEGLVDGKAALSAALAGETVQISVEPWEEKNWDTFNPLEDDLSTKVFFSGMSEGVQKVFFRIKPKTILINGVEVPAPFKPNQDESFYVIDHDSKCGYIKVSRLCHDTWAQFGAWRTEEEIKQVVAALRKVFEVQP